MLGKEADELDAALDAGPAGRGKEVGNVDDALHRGQGPSPNPTPTAPIPSGLESRIQ